MKIRLHTRQKISVYGIILTDDPLILIIGTVVGTATAAVISAVVFGAAASIICATVGRTAVEG
jgi:hypothetical protein